MEHNIVEISVENEDNIILESSYGKNAPPFYNEAKNVFNPSANMFKTKLNITTQTDNLFRRFFTKCTTYFCFSITIVVILAILMVLPVVMIIIGSYYLKSCPIQNMIPIWLVIFGSLLIIKNISTLVQRINSLKKGEEKSSSTAMNVFDSLMSMFIAGWFVCGNIWTYNIRNQVQFDNKLDLATYCSKTTFLFSFWLITSIYILICVGCLTFCITVCLTIFIPSKE